ncbi:MAG: AMP-binding protein, partial [Anaerolineae bacterium]
MIVGDLLRRGNKLYPERVAFRYQGRDFSYAELNQRVNRLANSMLRLGLRKGDRIAILAQNSNQYVETYLGSARIGVVTIPLNARLKGAELTYIINNGEAKALLIGPEFLDVIGSIREELPLVEHYVCLGQPMPGFEN